MEWQLAEVKGTPPPARYFHTAIYAAELQKMLVFGGEDGDGKNVNDLWILDMKDTKAMEWQLAGVKGTPPPARGWHTAVYAAELQKMLVFGGISDGKRLDDLWILDMKDTKAMEWQLAEVKGTPPPDRGYHTAVYAAELQKMLVFGGISCGTRLDDLWILDMKDTKAMEWQLAEVKGTPPPARGWHTAVYAAELQKMLVFGGTDGDDKIFDDLWILDMKDTKAMEWQLAGVKGTPPRARGWHTAVYAAELQKMLVFGGIIFDDLWILDMKDTKAMEWQLAEVKGTPPPARLGHTAVYAAELQKMLVFGGEDGCGKNFDDLWILDMKDTKAEVAEATLRGAMEGSDAAALEEAIGEGERLGLPDEVLLEAYDAMPRVQAAQRLVEAMSGGDLQALQTALAHAKELKVNSKVLLAGNRAMLGIQKDARTRDQGYVGPTLKEPQQALPDGKDAVPGMFSARFDGGEMEQKFRRVHKILKENNYPVRMVAAGGGDDFGTSTMKYLSELEKKGGVLICVCTKHYAEKTKSPFSSFHELKYAQDYQLDVLPLKVADVYPPRPPSGPDHPYDKEEEAYDIIKMVFRPNVAYTDCCDLDEMQIAGVIAEKLLKKKKKQDSRHG